MATKLPLPIEERQFALSQFNALIKRSFDVLLAIILLVALGPIIIALIVCARISTGESGIFRQERVGLFGDIFTVYKIRSMRKSSSYDTNVTTSLDPRITRFGWFVRKTKFDEFPQLINVISGDMSFVGPRPDVLGLYESLQIDFKDVLCIRPGITSPASIKFRNEEQLLGSQKDPEAYNREVIFPQKIEENRKYIREYSLLLDVKYLFKTLF